MTTINNVTTNSINLSSNRVVPANGSLIVDPQLYGVYASDEILWNKIALGELYINDGNVNLTISQAMDHLKGVFPSTVGLRGPVNSDLRSMIHATSRQYGLITNFTGAGDDQSNEYSIGGLGQSMAWHHAVLDPALNTFYMDLNTIENLTYIHSGIVQWLGALNDEITCEVVPKLTPYSVGTGLDFTLYGGYLIIPTSPGSGDVDVLPANRMLVEVPLNEAGIRMGAGYFDATWNKTTKQWENFAPNYLGTGQFNMFAAEVVLERFANRVPILGSAMTMLNTSDASMVGHNNRLKFVVETKGVAHEWWGNIVLALHRKKTT